MRNAVCWLEGRVTNRLNMLELTGGDLAVCRRRLAYLHSQGTYLRDSGLNVRGVTSLPASDRLI